VNVGAIVLAAGASFRMGSPKALLRMGEETFLQHVVGQLHRAGVDDVVIVLGADADEIRNSLPWFGGTIVVNQNWEEGQLTSVIAGLKALGQRLLDGVLIWPVDRPLIASTLIAGLLKAFRESGKSIVVPVFEGKRGHPAIFSSIVFDEICVAPLNVGARHVLRNHPDDIHELTTSEEGVLLNIDTPEDYKKYVERYPESPKEYSF
jgi:molybdenum cofactor cytidylyltransferase